MSNMIFSVYHIELIKSGRKTQTRRMSDRYEPGRSYSIQPGRGKKGIKEGVIMITRRRQERRQKASVFHLFGIMPDDAKAEGGYTPIEYENLYNSMYPGWEIRYAYDFVYVEINRE